VIFFSQPCSTRLLASPSSRSTWRLDDLLQLNYKLDNLAHGFFSRERLCFDGINWNSITSIDWIF
jgi:hypothetical protein